MKSKTKLLPGLVLEPAVARGGLGDRLDRLAHHALGGRPATASCTAATAPSAPARSRLGSASILAVKSMKVWVRRSGSAGWGPSAL